MEAQPTTAALVVGREAERAAIDKWLDADRPASLLIDGEAGIGKSTLWSYALDQAALRGDRVLGWRASSAEQDLAFAALTGLFDVPIIGPLLAQLSEPRRRALETAIGRAAPELLRPEPSLIGLAVVDILRAVASEGPVVVAIDDVQWTDGASEQGLAFAARRLRSEAVGFILARRTETPESGAVDLVSQAVDRRELIGVGPLSAGALGRLIHERLGVAHPRPLLVRLHEASSGNPFLALEISRSLLARTMEPGLGEPFPVPPEAGPLVRDHLTALSRDARRSVIIVAMSSTPTLGLVERVLGEVGGPAVDEACQEGVLVADGPRLRAAHPLFASTAYADAPPGERRALRRALAQIADDPVERAIHLAATVDGPDAGVADALAAAARTALGRGAPGVAAQLFERAAGLADRADGRATYFVEGARALVSAGDPTRAEAFLRLALEDVPHGSIRARALLVLGEIVYNERPEEALPLLLEALDHTDGIPVLEATVHSYVAGMADHDPQIGRRSALLAAQIVERPDVQADTDHLACALLDRAFHWLVRGERLARDDIDRAVALRTGVGDPFIVRRAQELAERCLYHEGRLEESLALDRVEHERLTARGEVGLLPPLLQSMAVLAQLSGDWVAARRYAHECMELVEGGEEVWHRRALLAQGRILAWEGDLDGARDIGTAALAREEADHDWWEAAIFCALLGFVELSVPDPPAALGYLLRAADHARTMMVVLPTVFRFDGDLVEAAVLAGDLDLAEKFLREHLEEPAKRVPLPWTLAMAARGGGLLASAHGEHDEAVRQLSRAVDIFGDSVPMPFERARTLLARGQVQRRVGRRRAAREDVSAALAVFRSLGAMAWSGRATDELGRIGGRTPTGSDLTVSERVVAELAAAGRSNREIAAELVVSVRTVESQLSAAYRKLDIQSRSQLSAALAAPKGPNPA